MERAAEMKIRVILDKFKFRRYRDILVPHNRDVRDICFIFTRLF